MMKFPVLRTIRGQLMGALILFELIVVGIFALLLAHQQDAELLQHLRSRLEYQAYLVAAEGGIAIQRNHPHDLQSIVVTAAQAPSVNAAQITDMQGRTMASSDPATLGRVTLSSKERRYLRALGKPEIFATSARDWEAVAPVVAGGQVRALAWIYPNELQDRQDLHSLLRMTVLWAIFVFAGCTAIAAILAESITRQLATLTRATRRLIQDTEDTGAFPLPVKTANEAAELTIAFNRMVAAIQEQRAGLNETLALLDSMLANAPIGFAFFDRKYRFVRVNQFLADMDSYAFALHLGRGADVILPPEVAARLEQSLENVFETGQPVRNLELVWETAPGRTRSWLAHLYPVRTDPETTRWVGAILVDTTEQKRSEEALRRTEKLAAAGRLAASVAHEINNPLEAVTNLLYLIRQSPREPASERFVEMAQQEVARVSEIAQQTLRFYRQSTLPAVANVAELLDSVLALHTGRVQTAHVQVERDYPPDLPLFCFAGELRQLFANLVTNALDAMTPQGGRLIVRARAAQRQGIEGVRVTVADTGCGIPPEAQRHIFEPFFTTKDATGTGLGLWVSDQIIRKHQGTVRMRSRAAGESTGTVFSLFFPAHGAGPAETEKEAEQEAVR
jgi:PAS domain S-box-containing protein